MRAYLRSAISAALFMGTSLVASAAATDYLFTPDVNGAGIDVSSIIGDTIAAIPGSPFNEDSAGLAGSPFELALSGDTLYAVYYTCCNADVAVADFSVLNGAPALISNAGLIPYINQYGPANFYPLILGSRLIILPESFPGPGANPTVLNILQNNSGSLKLLGSYGLVTTNYNQPLGTSKPTSVQTDAAQHYVYVTYTNANPQSTGIWKTTLTKGGTASMTISNQGTGAFEYQITTVNCTQTVSGQLTEDAPQLSGTGYYSQSGSNCSTVSGIPATLTGTVNGQQLTLTTDTASGDTTITYQKVISRLNPGSLYGECGSYYCLAIYDISRIPTSGPLLLQTSAIPGDAQSFAVSPPLQ